MLNHVVLMGRLTRDPEIRYTQTNIPVASYSLAVDRGYKDQSGKSLTDFIPCVAWDKRATWAEQYLYKGMLIAVDGQLQQRTWADREGRNRTTYEVNVSSHHFCESKAAFASRERPPHPAESVPPDADDEYSETTDDDGEVPF